MLSAVFIESNCIWWIVKDMIPNINYLKLKKYCETIGYIVNDNNKNLICGTSTNEGHNIP